MNKLYMPEKKQKLKLNIFLTSDLINKLKTKYKPSTVTTIQRNLKSIFLNAFDQDKFNINKLIKDHKEIIKYLRIQPLTRQTTLLFAIKTVLDLDEKKSYENFSPYVELHREIWEKKKERDKFTPPSKKEIEKSKCFDMKEIKEQADIELSKWLNDKENIKQYEKMMITQFLEYIPPLRAQDYTNIKILDDEPEELINHINLSTGDMVFYDYKTNKYYGKREIELPEDLVLLIAEAKDIFELNWLFPKLYKRDQSQSSLGITDLIQKTFNNPDIGTQYLRKCYISYLIDKGTNPKELSEIAHIMAHSIPTQINTYSSLSKKMHKEYFDDE